MDASVDTLVVDTAAFLNNYQLHRLSSHVVTVQHVIDEVRDRTGRQRLQQLCCDLSLCHPSEHQVRLVTQFARATGDLRHLSVTDIQVMALARQLTVEKLGGVEAAAAVGVTASVPPPSSVRVQVYHPARAAKAQDLPAGFVSGLQDLAVTNDQNDSDNDDSNHQAATEDSAQAGRLQLAAEPVLSHGSAHEQCSDASEDEDADNSTDSCDERSDDGDAASAVTASHGDNDEDVDDTAGWITPDNVCAARARMLALEGGGDAADDCWRGVACLTHDFSMQNVLRAMGVRVVAADGRSIQHVRRFIQRCFGCLQTTSDVTAVFCPHCGNNTLKRVSVTVGSNGEQVVHISCRKALSKRGTKFSLPRHRSAKYAVNPVLCADQPGAQQHKTTKRAQARSAMTMSVGGTPITAGPFSMHDVSSRAALHGAGCGSRSRHWLRRNPNQTLPSTGNRRKRR